MWLRILLNMVHKARHDKIIPTSEECPDGVFQWTVAEYEKVRDMPEAAYTLLWNDIMLAQDLMTGSLCDLWEALVKAHILRPQFVAWTRVPHTSKFNFEVRRPQMRITFERYSEAIGCLHRMERMDLPLWADKFDALERKINLYERIARAYAKIVTPVKHDGISERMYKFVGDTFRRFTTELSIMDQQASEMVEEFEKKDPKLVEDVLAAYTQLRGDSWARPYTVVYQDEVLPENPDACISRLDAIRDEKKRQLEAEMKEIDQLVDFMKGKKARAEC